MTSKYHTATFTESFILDKLGIGDELTTHIKGLYSGTLFNSPSVKANPYLSITQKTLVNAQIRYSGSAINLQTIFDTVHKEIPSFAIQELTLVRQIKEYDEYLLKDVYLTHSLHYKTWGFKTGTFKRYGATIAPCEIISAKFKERKQELKTKLPEIVYRRVKDCILMNENSYTRKQITKLFLDFDYMILLEEKDGVFNLREFGEM